MSNNNEDDLLYTVLRDKIDRLRAELAEWERRDAAHCPRAEKAEAAIERVRELRAHYAMCPGDVNQVIAASLSRALDGAE